MLKTNKSITLNGTVTINDTQVAYLNASLGTGDNTNTTVNQSITGIELYNANKTQARKDLADFQSQVYAIQDELDTETGDTNVAPDTSAEPKEA